MDARIASMYFSEVGGGNIHEFSSGFLIWRNYWYTNNMTEELSRKFHKTQRRDDIEPLEVPKYYEVAEFIFGEAEKHTCFIGLTSREIVKKMKIDKRYLDEMCAKKLLLRGIYKPKEPKKFLFWKISGTDAIEVFFPARRLISAYFVKKERSGEIRDI